MSKSLEKLGFKNTKSNDINVIEHHTRKLKNGTEERITFFKEQKWSYVLEYLNHEIVLAIEKRIKELGWV